ncbi:hypothetical protein [Paracoccus sp. (in: a-proteobacteria)]|uniref:hypothetical protein n=1 Tax=Paracoccus sp. TaxID=267 RepID=UPI0026E085A8|nr:hypothetical protein [Paracoccus sp. (in: a-proteobacteria)]MDO5647370.1 hypothetical protein [Paracoccus sp. (in: a-proteobacteria)]
MTLTLEKNRDAVLAVRRRLRDDFDYYCRHALKIRTKRAQIVPFSLNHAQRELDRAIRDQIAATGRVRIIILKARQQGLSTGVGGRLYQRVSQNTAKKAIVVTHKSDSTTALFNMTKRFFENTPAILKPSTSYSSKKEIVFDKLDSSYMVATAGGDGIARGETITHAHLSELAFWKESSARENLNGLLQSIPDADDTEIYIESTANGVTGPFYEMWKGAVDGTNGYYPLFIPWFLDPEYRTKPPDGFERTPEEHTLATRFDLDDAQLYWRRRKIAQNGPDLFKQEYPAVPEEAFLTTGRPVFDPEALTKRADLLTGPKHRMALELSEFRPHPVGELLLYDEIDPGGTYYIGADVAMGVRGGDYSVAQVLDERKRQVAVWRGHVHPDYFAEVLYRLGTLFNNAKIAVESNNHGLLTVGMLYKVWAYPNVFTHVTEDKIDDLDTPQLGFRTDSKTKPLIIDDLRASLRKGEVELNDKTTISEMLTYVVKESGKLEAEEGCHDDCVMSLAIVNHIHDGVWNPITNTEAYYLEAI